MFSDYHTRYSLLTDAFHDQKYYETQAKSLEQRGKYEEAVENNNKLFRIWDFIPASGAHFNRVVYTYERQINMLFKLRQPLEAVACHQRLLEIEKKAYNDGVDYRPYHETGKKLLEAGLYEEALDFISQTYPKDHENCVAAVDFYDRVIEMNPNLAKTYNLKGNALRQLNKEVEAQECFQIFERLSLGPQEGLNNRNPGLEGPEEEEKTERTLLINPSAPIVRSEESPQNLVQNSQINLIFDDPRDDNVSSLAERLSREPRASPVENVQRIEASSDQPQSSLQAENYQMRPTFRRVPIDKLLLLKQEVALKLRNRPGQFIPESSQHEIDNFNSLVRLNPLNQKIYYTGAKYCFKQKLYAQAQSYIEKALEIGSDQRNLNHDVSETSSITSLSDTESVTSSSNRTTISNTDLLNHPQLNSFV